MEIVVDFRNHPTVLPPLIISNSTGSNVYSFKFLRYIISLDLKQVNVILKKAQQRMYFYDNCGSQVRPSQIYVDFST